MSHCFCAPLHKSLGSFLESVPKAVLSFAEPFFLRSLSCKAALAGHRLYMQLSRTTAVLRPHSALTVVAHVQPAFSDNDTLQAQISISF